MGKKRGGGSGNIKAQARKAVPKIKGSVASIFEKVVSPLFYLLYFLSTLLLGILEWFKKPIKTNKKKARSKKTYGPTLAPPSYLLLLILSCASATLIWTKIFVDLPSPEALVNRDIEISTKIYDRNGVLLYKIYKDKNRTLLTLSQIPPQVQLATLAAEDAEFYNHPGISLRGISRAFWKNINEGGREGGSTITQQLVKNALLTSEKTLTRKIKEVILALLVERKFSKDQILEMYMNEIAYGGTAYGIQEAARTYFNKDVDKLTLAEAAYLAGLPKKPTQYSPFGPTPEQGLARQKDVLNLMRINGFISNEEMLEATKDELVFASKAIDIKAPHFVTFVRQILEEKYGGQVVAQGGLEVTTSLDYSIQKMAEEVTKNEVDKLARLRVGNGATVVVNPTTGEILAMVGSKDYFDTENDGNVNVTTSSRQPGSSIKVVNYAYALSHGYTLASILDDSVVSFKVPGQPPYSPKNYDGKYRGKIPLRNALAESRNIPAVRTLASFGVDKMLTLGKIMGITTWNDTDRFGLSLTLGGGEVKLLELARVYSVLANQGRAHDTVSILKVVDHDKRILEEHEEKEVNQVLDPRIAFLITDVLKDNFARSPAFGINSQLVIKNHPEVAVKTGTSNDLKDNLTVGYSQKYVVAVWVGNNSGAPMARIASGITGAAPIFNKIMTSLLANEKPTPWVTPEGVVRATTCQAVMLPCIDCLRKTEWFLKENTPKGNCTPASFTIQKKQTKIEGKLLPEAASTTFGNFGY